MDYPKYETKVLFGSFVGTSGRFKYKYGAIPSNTRKMSSIALNYDTTKYTLLIMLQ